MAECKRGVRVRPDPISGRVVAGMRLREPKKPGEAGKGASFIQIPAPYFRWRDVSLLFVSGTAARVVPGQNTRPTGPSHFTAQAAKVSCGCASTQRRRRAVCNRKLLLAQP